MVRRPRWVAKAEETIDEHTAPAPGDRKYVTGPAARTTNRRVLRNEQQDEMAESWLGLGLLTDAQFKGAVIGAIVGALLGPLIALPLGLVVGSGLSVWWRLGIAALCGALAVSVGLALYLGGRQPELEGETMDVDDRPSVGTSLRDPRTDERGR